MGRAMTVEDARALYEAGGGGHDFDHVLRVTTLAGRIARAEGADLDIVRTAALLHDVAESVDREAHHLLGAQRAREILAGRTARNSSTRSRTRSKRIVSGTSPSPAHSRRKCCPMPTSSIPSARSVWAARLPLRAQPARPCGGRRSEKLLRMRQYAKRGPKELGEAYTPSHEFVYKLNLIPSGSTPTWRDRSPTSVAASWHCFSSAWTGGARRGLSYALHHPRFVDTHRDRAPLPPRLSGRRRSVGIYVMGLRNRDHLQKFEAGNAVMGIRNEEDAERIMREFVVDWLEGRAFFLGVFRRDSEEFVAQIYVGVAQSATCRSSRSGSLST